MWKELTLSLKQSQSLFEFKANIETFKTDLFKTCKRKENLDGRAGFFSLGCLFISHYIFWSTVFNNDKNYLNSQAVTKLIAQLFLRLGFFKEYPWFENWNFQVTYSARVLMTVNKLRWGLIAIIWVFYLTECTRI